MIGINSSDNNNPAVNKSDSFRKFWLSIEKEKLKKLELEKKVLKLKKRELLRRYTSIATMVPFAILMAAKLGAACSNEILLDLVNRILSYTPASFMALSLTCASYSIYNNREIKKKEQELKDLENAEVTGKNGIFYIKDDYVNYVDAFTSTLGTLGNIAGKISKQAIIEDLAFLFWNIVGFCMKCTLLHSETKKSKKRTGEAIKFGKNTSNISATKFILIGIFALLVKTIMLMTIESSVGTNITDSIIGLAGISSIMTGYVLNTRFYSSELQDTKVTEEAEIEIRSNIIDIDHDSLIYELDRERA